MATNTPNMNLTAWDLGSDPYSHSQLANNFEAIDSHDHTSGHGVQIPSGGIANGAITNAKLAANAVTTDKIQDGTIIAADLDPNFLASIMPLRAVIPWWRENSGIPVPSLWAVCDGTAWSSITNDMGLAVGSIPDLRNRFILGAATSGTGTTPSLPPAIGATGGSNSLNLAHTHTIATHTHTVAAHSHATSPHSHSISFVADHIHGFDSTGSGSYQALAQRGAATSVGSTLQAAYVVSLNSGNNSSVFINMEPKGGHDHGASTGATTDGIGSTSLTTDAGGTGATGSALSSSTDTRPQYTGLLYIMKVKNS